jgi:DNA repair protein RecO (recombination protein O)
MSVLVTDAIVLHAFDYLESSRIMRLATREAGVQSVLARGARRSRARFGSALDLFAGGVAEIQVRPGRDLQSLTSFDVTRARPGLAGDLDRFAAASALAEIELRFVGEDGNDGAFDALEGALDALGRASGGAATDAGLAGGWHILAQLGFAPSIDVCAACHAEVAPDARAHFSHPLGGTLCERCARSLRASRTVPASARAALREWLRGGEFALGDDLERRAHLRLLREFVREHLADERALPAFEMWERSGLGIAVAHGEDAGAGA